MATNIVMPNLGFDTQEGRLVEWLKKVGDSVERGEVIAIVESDKANVELESIASGVLIEQLFPADSEIKVGAVIARIGKLEEIKTVQPVTSTVPAAREAISPAPIEISPVARRFAQENNVDLRQVTGSGTRGRITREDIEAFLIKHKDAPQGSFLALPKVRKAAREAGIDLNLVPATGKHGEVTLDDLKAYRFGEHPTAPLPPLEAFDIEALEELAEAEEAPAPPPLPEGVREVKLSRIRQLIGKRLGKSKRKAPHFYVTGEFDLEAALSHLTTYPAPQPGINDLLQYLTVQTLLRLPELNATFEEKKLFYHQSVNLAVAVARADGLITPVVHGAERYSLPGLAAESRAVIKRARDNRLQPNDLQGGTFTISNLGIIPQVEHFTAVINPPQVAILAVGTVKQRPVVKNGGLHVRHTVHLTLSGDHRVVDGMHLGRFMAIFQEELDRFS